MGIKIEIDSSAKLPRQLEANLEKILSTPPREHSRGIERVRIVDKINDARIKPTQIEQLPGLYHPKQGAQPAWLEIAINPLLKPAQPLHKRLLPRLSFKSNVAAVTFSLIGQHYYLTLRHSVKKGQIEPAVKAYTEKYLRQWSEGQHSFRARLFKPLQPTFERWARTLQRRASEERRKKS